MKNNIVKMAILPVFILIAACGSAEKKEETTVATQVQAQPPADTPEQILARAAQAFSTIEGLEPAKQDKLRETYSRVYTESMSIRREIGQSKSLLFATLAKPDYKASEITKLKKKIVGLDEKRLALMFKALDDVQAIIGKGPGREELFKRLERYETPGHMLSSER
ncbi:MAG: hypothetical protein IPM97_11375 [Bdellovibrionaceae bacterium]|nr:hypothetical protein [Pseudobdellovibrionaceae bacterium]